MCSVTIVRTALRHLKAACSLFLRCHARMFKAPSVVLEVSESPPSFCQPICRPEKKEKKLFLGA